MSGKEARTKTKRRSWKTWLSAAGGVLAVGALCFAVHRYSGAEAARAQSSAKGKTAASAKSAATKPNASDQAGAELKVVAMVNNEQITRQELARECLHRYGKDMIQDIINKHLILQACQKRGVTITEKDVEDEIGRIATKFGLAKDRWLALLEEERNISPGEYRREIIWPTLALRTLAANQIEVTPAELRAALESEHGPQVKARLIALETQKKAQEVLAIAKANPDDFEMLAKDFSKDPSASVMGLIPPIRKHLGEQILEEAAFRLKPGEISPIIPVGNLYVILKCEQQIKGKFLNGKELAKVQEHLSDRIRDQKMRAASADLFAKLQKESQIENVYNDPKKQKQNPGVAAVINGQPVTIRQLSEDCITRHGTLVLDGEINRLILTQELKRKNRTVEEQDLNDEVARAADTYGYVQADGSPDVDKWLKVVTEKDGATVDLYLRDAVWPSAALKKLAGGNVTVSEDDLQKGFEANYGERVEVLAIVLGNQRQAQQVWEQARDNPTDNAFGELAQQYSIEPASKANFGKVPPIRRHGGQPAVEAQAFKLKPGEVSGIISIGDKFIVLRCLGRTTPLVKEMDDVVRRELKKDVLEKKLRLAMNKEFDRLKEESHVDNFLSGESHTPAPRSSKTSVSSLPSKSEPRTGSVSNKAAASTASGPRPPAR